LSTFTGLKVNIPRLKRNTIVFMGLWFYFGFQYLNLGEVLILS
jgi:hypothetical protein